MIDMSSCADVSEDNEREPRSKEWDAKDIGGQDGPEPIRRRATGHNTAAFDQSSFQARPEIPAPVSRPSP